MDIRNAADRGPIVVGVERSERSRDALALARTLARAAGTRLILASVYTRAARSDAQSTLERLARPLGGVRSELRAVSCTSVSRGLQQLAAAEGALAIVVGPSHRGRVGRIVPGSVGTSLLHGAPCPVAVAPAGYWGGGQSRIRQIGVGYVSSPEGAEALDAAIGLAACIGAKVRVLGVVEPVAVTAAVPSGLDYVQREESTRADLTEGMQHAIAHAAAPVEISGEIADGYADDELARLSGEVDLLVCGSRGNSPLGGVMLGSVSTGVLRKSRTPVLIIPRGARDGFAALRARTAAAA